MSTVNLCFYSFHLFYLQRIKLMHAPIQMLFCGVAYVSFIVFFLSLFVSFNLKYEIYMNEIYMNEYERQLFSVYNFMA